MFIVFYFSASQEARAEILPPVEAQVAHSCSVRAAELAQHNLKVARAGRVDHFPSPALMLQDRAARALAHAPKQQYIYIYNRQIHYIITVF